MADVQRLQIPYESLDPLTIGAADDETKVYREQLELEVPSANILAAIYPDEPEPVANATEEARSALENPVSGPAFADLLAGKQSVAIVIDNQFRPTPASKLLPRGLRRGRKRPGSPTSASSPGTARCSRCRSPTSR